MPEQEAPEIDAEVRRALADRTNGWWVGQVLAGFDFLVRDFDYRLTEVRLHFRGSSTRHSGAVFDLVISYDPEDTGRLSAELWVRDDLQVMVEHPRAFAVNDVIRARDPDAVLPDPGRLNLDPAEVRQAITVWASALRELAPDVLRGAWPDGVATTYLW